MIPGGPADATAFAGIARRLSDSYTVVTYDPRGLSRSQLDVVPEDQRIVETMADDAHRLLAAVGSEPAFVFANSGGVLLGPWGGFPPPPAVRSAVSTVCRP